MVKQGQEEVEMTVIPGGDILKGDITIARYLARGPSSEFYGTDALSASKIDMWIEHAQKSADLPGALNAHLQLRTFIVGYSLTLADIVAFSALLPSWPATVESRGKTIPHAVRWFKHIESLPQVAGVLSAGASNTKAAEAPTVRKGRAGWLGSYDIELPDAKEGGVVTRFPPEPSGFLHIGHIKASLLNNYFAELYQGKLILRFDDTNPAKEKDEFTENIKKDLETLEIKPHAVTYTSDYFDQLLQFGEQVLKSGKAYIDNTPQAQMREERTDCIESKCRNNSVEENLRLWGEMKKGTEEGQKCVMRAKIDMKSPNGAMRDPGLYRCSPASHYRTGTKYKVYPMYDFACPIVDSLEGVTHALRSSEYHDRNPLYYWVVDAVGVRKPHIEDFSRLNFEYVLLSKRKLQWFVDNNHVAGWDDPRFPTVQGILRRGLTVEALKEFILAQGASKALNLMNMDKLWAINKKIIDPIIPRYTALDATHKVPFTLTNGPLAPEMRTVPRHKKNPALGNKAIVQLSQIFLELEDATKINLNEEITLMDWGNAIVRKINHDNGKLVSLEGELHLEGDFKKTEKKLTWLANTHELVPVILQEYGYLITKKKLEESDNFIDYVNQNSLTETRAVGDSSLRLLNKGDKLQLERRGYYIVDQVFAYPAKPLVLIAIPDGKEAPAAPGASKPSASKPSANKQQKKQKTTQ